MSMILQALRKSEAERQRGRAPGLFVEQRPAQVADRRVPAWAWGLGALLVAVLLAWAWREWQRAQPPAAPSPAPDAVVEATPGPAAERIEDLPGVATPLTLPAEPPASAAPAVPPSLPGRIEPAPAAPALVEPMPVPTPTPVPAPAAAVGPAPAPAPAAAPSSAPADAIVDAPAPAEAPSWLPGLGTLAASERASLPPLKLSMHVFAENPGQRFVILDGQRLGEGASPAAGVVLEEIRRDGLVLSVNGQRLLLARP